MPRRLPCVFAGWILLLVAVVAAGDEPPETLLLQDPAVSAQHVVFTYAGDLWVVGRGGGTAQRLTSHVGREFYPRISPDGRWVAFSGEYDGNTDVYVIPIAGGVPRRLTWHPSADLVRDWHPDGRRVLFASARQGGAPVLRLFLVGLDGLMPEALALPKVFHASYNADATRIAFTPIVDAFRTWKRYRGGRTTPVWIYDPAGHGVEEIPHVNATDTFPCWLNGDVYFASDRDGRMNLWRFTPGSAQPEQITRFPDFDVRNLASGGGVLAFEQGGAIHLYDPAKKEFTRLRITVMSDGLAALPRWQDVKGQVRNASIAPNGKRAVFEARGEIISVPREHGDPRNLTESPGVHDRDPAWSPDGKQIAWLSDQDGEYKLRVRDALGREPAKAYDLGGGGFLYQPQWSPDGKHILFFDKTNRLAFVTLETGKVTEVARNRGSLGVYWPNPSWHPDSKWIAFTSRHPETAYDRLCLFEVEKGRVIGVTDDFGSADSPVFSHDGKYLFFTASVEAGPQRFGLDMSASAARSYRNNLYVAVLKKSEKNPLAPKSDEGVDDEKEGKKKGEGDKKEGDDKDGERKNGGKDEEEKGEKKEKNGEDEKDGKEEKEGKEGKGGKEKKPEGPAIDPEGLDQRILALPIPAGTYDNLLCSKKKLLFLERSEGGDAELKSFDFEDRKVESVAKDVSWFLVSADGKNLLLRTKGDYAGMSLENKEKKEFRIESVKVRVDPAREWPQLLREVWRIQRDYFYDPNLHGIDWPAMWDRWSAFLPHVRHRSDLNLLIAEMIGELACGHEYVSGGDTPRVPSGPSVGLLGADFEVADGRFRITRIYRGQNWSPGMRAPLTEPGVDAREGDYLVKVAGREIKADENLYAAFADTADRQVEIVLSARADGSEPRAMTVVPVGDDGGLRRQAWVEENRKRVERLSGGRLAYVYMPDTGGAGMAAFNRDFFSQVDKEGIVIDERYNGGGKVADYVLSVLARQVLCYWMNREGWLGRTPFGTIEGPKVMVINERAGSGGDAMPWLFRQMGLGPLVGTRTWGGLVGISGYPPLMDGGSVTAASFGVMDRDGNWAVENVGVAPDHEVIEWPKDMIAGRDPQLETAVDVAMKELAKQPARKKPTYVPPAKR